jgi:hypothetical protein
VRWGTPTLALLEGEHRRGRSRRHGVLVSGRTTHGLDFVTSERHFLMPVAVWGVGVGANSGGSELHVCPTPPAGGITWETAAARFQVCRDEHSASLIRMHACMQVRRRMAAPPHSQCVCVGCVIGSLKCLCSQCTLYGFAMLGMQRAVCLESSCPSQHAPLRGGASSSGAPAVSL